MSSSSAATDQFRCDEVPDQDVKRVRWSPQIQDTSELGPSESRSNLRGWKRQPDSTTEDLEDAGDQGDSRGDAEDEDMKALGAVCEEHVITIGVDGEKLNEGENSKSLTLTMSTEVSWILRWSGKHVWKN